MTSFRPVSWLAGRRRGRLPDDLTVTSGIHGRELSAYSCGRSAGLIVAREGGKFHRLPMPPLNVGGDA